MKLAGLTILLAVLGCSDKKKPSGTGTGEVGPPPITCDSVGAVITKNWAERGKRATSDYERENATKMAPIASKRLIKHCIDDRWTTDAVTCVVAELERRGREELEKIEGSGEARPAKAEQIDKCLSEAQIAKLMGTAPPADAPRNPPPAPK